MTFRNARLRAAKSTGVRNVFKRQRTLVDALEVRSMLSSSAPRTTSKAPSPQIEIDAGGLVPGGHGQAGGDYQLRDRWTRTATNPTTGNSGDPITLTWGFVDDGLMIPGYNTGEAASASNLIASLNSLYGSQATWLPLFQSIFDVWSAKTGVSYVYQPTDDGSDFGAASGQLGVRADVRIGGHNVDGVSKILAYNFYPGDESGGDMVVDTSEFNAAVDATPAGVFRITSNNSRPLRNALAHEHGHGLGLAHVIPTNGTKLLEPFLTTSFDGPQYDDILGVQSLYGDPLEKNGRNETPATASNLGTLAPGALTLATNVSTSTNDIDYFQFTLGANRTVGLSAAPVGVTYNEGPQTGATAPFNAGLQADLALDLYAADGTTLIQSANLGGLGASEQISDLALAAGIYVARVSGSGAPQMYQLTATVAVPPPPAAPSTPILAAASDSGDSSSDGITNITTPIFTGTADAGSTVTLRAGTTVVGSVTSAGDGSWSITSTALADGTYAFTATATGAGGTSVASSALGVTIDTVAPTVAVSYDREVTQDLTLAFESHDVASKLSLGEAALTRESNLSGAASPPQVVPLSTLGIIGAAATFDIGSLLGDGRYRLSIAPNAVTDVAGNPLASPISFAFSQLAGDANNNGRVDFADLVILAQNYNLSGKTFSQGNFNYDAAGHVDFGDLVLLAQRYNLALPAFVQPSPAIVSAPAAGGRTVSTNSRETYSNEATMDAGRTG